MTKGNLDCEIINALWKHQQQECFTFYFGIPNLHEPAIVSGRLIYTTQYTDTCCIRPLKGGYFGDTSFPNNPGVAKKRSKNEVPLPKMELTNLISAKGWKMRWLFTPYSNGVTGWKMRTTTPRNLTNIPKMPLFWRDLPFSELPSLGIYLKHPKVYSISGTCKIVIPRGCFSKTSFWGPMVHFPA